MRVSALIVVCMSLLGFVEPALAQPAAPSAQQQQRRDKVKQRIRALRAYTLTEQLELDEATAAKLFPALAKYDDEFDKLLLARADVLHKLDGAGAIKDAKAVDKLIDEAVANQRAIWDTEAKRLDQLRKILTPAQVARVLIVLPAMERKIQNQLRKVTQRSGKGAGAGAARTESDDDLKSPFGDERFDKNGEIDPFPGAASGSGAAKKRNGGAKNEPCDPFASVHGCSK